jgi:hypothetical protein
MPWIKGMIVSSTAPQNADVGIARDESDGDGGEAGHQQDRDQGCIAPDAIAPVTKDRGTDRAPDKTDGKHRERLEHPDQRVGLGKNSLPMTSAVTWP